ncbi:MAG: hypothetical protein QM669_08130 [Siphonobacter sp.]
MEKKPFRLEDLPRKDPFTTPPAPYFDELPQRIQARIREQDKKSARIINWSPSRLWLATGAAAAIAVMTYLSWPVRQDSIGTDSLSLVQRKEIISYLQQQNVSPQDLSEIYENDTFLDSLANQPLQLIKVSKAALLEQIPLEDLDI